MSADMFPFPLRASATAMHCGDELQVEVKRAFVCRNAQSLVLHLLLLQQLRMWAKPPVSVVSYWMQSRRLLQSLVWTVSHPLTGKWKAIMQTATRGQMVVCELVIFSYFISLLFSRLDVFVTCSLIWSFDGSARGTHHPAYVIVFRFLQLIVCFNDFTLN